MGARSHGDPSKASAGLAANRRARSAVSNKSPRKSASGSRGSKTSAVQTTTSVRRNSRASRIAVDDESEYDFEGGQQRGAAEFEDDEELHGDEEENKDDMDEEDDFEDAPNARLSGQRSGRRRERPLNRATKSSARSSSRRVVPYARPNQPSPAALAFTRGIAAIRDSIPDASALRETALSTINAARETTGVLTANIYREVKGLTSSELEQVMLKATRPDDSPVKGKHVERLVGVTYQISARYDIYDAVLRK